MQIKEWDPEDLEGIRLKTAELLSWREIEYSRDGYMVGHGPGRKDLKVVPSYARDIRAAWEVVEALNKQQAEIIINNPRKGIPEFSVEILFPDGRRFRAVHQKVATAICLAFVESSRAPHDEDACLKCDPIKVVTRAMVILLTILAIAPFCAAASPSVESSPPASIFLAPPTAAAPDLPPASPALSLDPESVEYPLGRGVPGVAGLFGMAAQQTQLGWDTAPTMALRYYFHKPEMEGAGAEALSPWSIEVGTLLPHAMKMELNDGYRYTAKVKSFISEHAALQYRWRMRRPFRMTPEVSVGIALAQFHYDYAWVNGNTETAGSGNYFSVGPHLRLGAPLLANDWLSFRMDLGYAYSPFKANVGDRSYDLSVKGLGVYPSLQISLGYLHTEIDKSVYLPPSSLPLWALSALQTEKRSPIIAPPEVLLNSRLAQAQGGLSGNVLFQYKSRSATKVEILGEFNQWQPEPMYMDEAHVWITVKDLKAGTYHYTYLINGKREIRDPWNTSLDLAKRPHGSSVLVVQEVSPY